MATMIVGMYMDGECDMVEERIMLIGHETTNLALANMFASCLYRTRHLM